MSANNRVPAVEVVHEMAHLEEKSHSQYYWNKVKIMLPYYKERQEWLKENGYLLGWKDDFINQYSLS